MPYKDPDKRRANRREYYHKHKETWKQDPEYKKRLNANNCRSHKKNRLLTNKRGRDWHKSKAGQVNQERNKPRVNEAARRGTAELNERYIIKQLVKLGHSRLNLKNHPETINTFRYYLETKRMLVKITKLLKSKKP